MLILSSIIIALLQWKCKNKWSKSVAKHWGKGKQTLTHLLVPYFSTPVNTDSFWESSSIHQLPSFTAFTLENVSPRNASTWILPNLTPEMEMNVLKILSTTLFKSLNRLSSPENWIISLKGRILAILGMKKALDRLLPRKKKKQACLKIQPITQNGGMSHLFSSILS